MRKLKHLGILACVLFSSFALSEGPHPKILASTPKKIELPGKVRAFHWFYEKFSDEATLFPALDLGWIDLAAPLSKETVAFLKAIPQDDFSASSDIRDASLIREILKGYGFSEGSNVFIKFLDSGRLKKVPLKEIKKLHISWESEQSKRAGAHVFLPIPRKWWEGEGGSDKPMLATIGVKNIFSREGSASPPKWEAHFDEKDVRMKFEEQDRFFQKRAKKGQCDYAPKKMVLGDRALYLHSFNCKERITSPFSFSLKTENESYNLFRFSGSDYYITVPDDLRIGQIIEGKSISLYISGLDGKCGKIFFLGPQGEVSFVELVCTPSSC